jgi:hypothetical protein
VQRCSSIQIQTQDRRCPWRELLLWAQRLSQGLLSPL